jgi:outer membrane protein TolC
MKRRFRWALALSLVPAAVAAVEAPAPRWTPSAAVARAIEVHPALAAARARGVEAERARDEAAAARGPVASARITGQRFGEPMLVSPIHSFGPGAFPDFDETLVQGSLDLRYTLLDAGARRERLRQAEARRDAAGAGTDATEQELIARVAAAYVETIARSEALDAARTRVDAVRRELDRVRLLLGVGRAADLERLRAEAALAAAEAAEASAGARLDATERELARLLGVDPDSARAAALAPAASAPAPPAPRAELEARARAVSPALERARREAAASEAARALARTAYFPELRAVGAFQQLGGAELDFATEWNAGLVLAIPLWDGGATASRVARAEAARTVASAAVVEAELAVAAAIDRALAAGTEARTRAEALGRAAERLAEVVRVERLRLEVGAGIQVDYLDAEAELAAARAERAAAAASALVARVELARATGELDLDWIRDTLEARP